MSTDPAEPPAQIRLPLRDMREDQIRLLEAALRAGEIPAQRSADGIAVPARHARAAEQALRWVLSADGLADEEGDDPALSRGLGPVVKPSRPPLADGRRPATRMRRFAAGMIDIAVAGVPALVALRADVPIWAVAPAHAAYFVLPTAFAGWTVGKRITGLKIVDRDSLGNPGIVASLLRWALLAAPLLAAAMTDVAPDVVVLAGLATPLTGLWSLRGVHDRAAGTVVVERSPLGPELWIRARRTPPVSS